MICFIYILRYQTHQHCWHFRTTQARRQLLKHTKYPFSISSKKSILWPFWVTKTKIKLTCIINSTPSTVLNSITNLIMFLPYSRIFPRCCPRLMIDEEWFSRSRVHFHLPALRERRITRCTTLINFHLMAMCCKAQWKRALPSIFSEDKWVASTTSLTSAITPCWSQRIMGLLQVIYERVGISTPRLEICFLSVVMLLLRQFFSTLSWRY